MKVKDFEEPEEKKRELKKKIATPEAFFLSEKKRLLHTPLTELNEKDKKAGTLLALEAAVFQGYLVKIFNDKTGEYSYSDARNFLKPCMNCGHEVVDAPNQEFIRHFSEDTQTTLCAVGDCECDIPMKVQK